MTKVEIIELSHNRLVWDDALAYPSFSRFFMATASPRTSILDVSYNLIKEPFVADKNGLDSANPAGYGLLLSAEGPKYPSMVMLDISHNFLWGHINLDDLFYNVDMSYNNITVLDFLWATDCCSAVDYKRQMYSVDWRHQMSSVKLATVLGRNGEYMSIDQALNSSVDFKLIEFMPRHDSFEQMELPPGSGRFPFVCPTWFVG
jgi:hypothetical protein